MKCGMPHRKERDRDPPRLGGGVSGLGGPHETRDERYVQGDDGSAHSPRVSEQPPRTALAGHAAMAVATKGPEGGLAEPVALQWARCAHER